MSARLAQALAGGAGTMWIDPDFPRILDPAVSRPDLHQLLEPEFDDGSLRSPTLRVQLIQEWLVELEHHLPLDGYDQNVLRHWAESGFAGPRPKLSIELQAPFRAQQEEARRLRQEAKARWEAEQYQRWLQDARTRQEVEGHQRLLREYPRTYPAFIKAEQEAREQERQRREQLIREAAEAVAKRVEEQRRLDAVREELEEERRVIHQLALAYMKDPIRSEFRLSEAEFLRWCEEIASPEEVERMTEALRVRGLHQRMPAWRRWLNKTALDFLSD